MNFDDLSTIDYDTIQYTLKYKTTIYDEETNTVLAISENHMIAIQPEIINIINSEYFNGVIEFLEGEEAPKSIIDTIYKLLMALETYYSNHYISDETYEKSKELIYFLIKEILSKGEQKEKTDVLNAIVTFLEYSLKNIPKDVFTCKLSNGTIDIDLSESNAEKRNRRAFFISDMAKSGIIDFDLLMDLGTAKEFSFEQIEKYFRQRGLITKEQLIEVMTGMV